MSDNNSQLPGFIPSIWGYFANHAISTKEKVLIAGLAILYALSPLDVIPDVIPFLGYLDDVSIGALVAAFCSWRNRSVLAQQNADATAQDPQETTPPPQEKEFFSSATQCHPDDNAPVFEAEIVTGHDKDAHSDDTFFTRK